MRLLIAGLALFLGIHALPMIPSLRAALQARWGEQRYKGVFSLIGSRARADRGRLCGSRRSHSALRAVPRRPVDCAVRDGSVIHPVRRREHAGTPAADRQASDAAGSHDLGNGAPARERRPRRHGALRRFPRLCGRRSCFGRSARRGEGVRPGAKARPDRRCRRCRGSARGHDLPSDPVRRSRSSFRCLMNQKSGHATVAVIRSNRRQAPLRCRAMNGGR